MQRQTESFRLWAKGPWGGLVILSGIGVGLVIVSIAAWSGAFSSISIDTGRFPAWISCVALIAIGVWLIVVGTGRTLIVVDHNAGVVRCRSELLGLRPKTEEYTIDSIQSIRLERDEDQHPRIWLDGDESKCLIAGGEFDHYRRYCEWIADRINCPLEISSDRSVDSDW
ncbi:MAG: hypothetical protein AAGH88_02180 [Planctomycetota bacterium]